MPRPRIERVAQSVRQLDPGAQLGRGSSRRTGCDAARRRARDLHPLPPAERSRGPADDLEAMASARTGRGSTNRNAGHPRRRRGRGCSTSTTLRFDRVEVLMRWTWDSDRYKVFNFIEVAACNSIPRETHRGPARVPPSAPWSP